MCVVCGVCMFVCMCGACVCVCVCVWCLCVCVRVCMSMHAYIYNALSILHPAPTSVLDEESEACTITVTQCVAL